MEFFKFLLMLVCVELILGIFYYFITPEVNGNKKAIDYKSLLKGVVERMFLTISLINNYPHALTLFGTLKLATRLKRDNEDDKEKESKYNDFYLLGNLVSIIISIMYVFLYNKFTS
ncbi:hypothetical protein QWY99_13450 [Flavobacterium branchiarum]|nr:hypothetical protein [Flavobacterium branchiarum]MDN3674061.1 hypothetical protein [Flavobacterium branchiarum]